MRIFFLYLLLIQLSPLLLKAGEGSPHSDDIKNSERISINLEYKSVQKPLLDGEDKDKCWSLIQPYSIVLTDNSSLRLKTFSDNNQIYLLLKIKSAKEVTRHRPWKWDPIRQLYVPEDSIEDTLYIMFSKINVPEKRDFWIWRSARNNSIGFADDFYLDSENVSGSIGVLKNKAKPDKGEVCWFSKYYSKPIGLKLKRFHNRKPTESAADIRSVGKWKDGEWTIEMCRQLDTGHKDDVVLSNGYYVLSFMHTNQENKKGAESSRCELAVSLPEIKSKKESQEDDK